MAQTEHKVALIVPYFGKFPDFFNVFLKSVAYNPEFDWLIFTDDKTAYDYPANVKVHYTTFHETINLVKSKIGENSVLERPHKLCDYKPTYGHVFSEYLSDYTFWGHCDIDVVYGKLSDFYTNDILDKYDKVSGLGHFTLYRNAAHVNTAYQLPLKGVKIYEKVFADDMGHAFDEWHADYGGINQIFIQEGFPFLTQNFCANISGGSQLFLISDYNLETSKYEKISGHEHIFVWDKGILTQHYLEGGEIKTKPYSYIHFHKRKMAAEIDLGTDVFWIVPDKFIMPEGEVTKAAILKYSQKPLVNKQFIKVRINNIRYRIKQLLKKLKR